MYTIIYLQIKRVLLFLSILHAFIYFSHFIVLARTHSTMLNRSNKKEHACLVPNFREITQCFTIKYDIVSRFFAYVLCQVEDVSFLVCWEFLSWMIVDFYQLLSRGFYWDDLIVFFFLFRVLRWWIKLINVKPTYIPEVNQTCSWCIILFIYCWILLAKF